ncbi:MAG: PEP-CTERM sorting domain-containing protein [Myxococcales bacterium]|nr:PEP-CTERM sorting domain-containing protein [Myxococcales bacterium]
MNFPLKAARALVAIAAALTLSAPAHAVLIFQDAAGNTVAAPSVLDASNEAIYFTETSIPGGGQYTVTNNTTGYGLLAFGISNFDTVAWIGSFGSAFGCDSGGGTSWCYASSNLGASNWDSADIDSDGNTGFDIFGDIANVLDPGDNTLNFYQAADGELLSGNTWDEFLYSGLLSSQLFVVLGDGSGGTIYGSGGAPVPEPGVALLLASGLAALAIRRSKLG